MAKHEQANISEEEIIIDREEKEKIDFSIKVNKISFVFYFLFIALALYLIIGNIAILPPFQYNVQTQELTLNTTFFIILLITDLIFLMIGMYFSWFWKGAGKDEEIREEEKTAVDEEEIVFTDEELAEIESVEDS